MKSNFDVRAFFACFAAALPAYVGAAQPAPIDIKTVAYRGSLPYVVSADPRRDARINHSVFLALTGQPAPAKYTDRVVETQEQEEMGVNDFGFKVTRDDQRVLALEIDSEVCGAYCEHSWDQYNFDAVTGRAILASDIFTPAGGAKLFKQNLAKRLAQYQQAIAGLNRAGTAHRKKNHISTSWPQPRTDGRQDDEEARIMDTIAMYRHCMESMQSPDYGSDFKLENAPVRIEYGAITFLYQRCSNHAMHALDEVDKQEVSYKNTDLAPHITPYGRYLLMDGPPVKRRAEPYQQFLQGRVGQAAITLTLSAPGIDGAVTGEYFYNKYRKLIALRGQVNGNTVELTESESIDTPKPLIRATIKGDKLEGQWIGKQTLDFSVAP
ncbi:hypothetical protein GM658_00530 [Pseudoduganella eburnea]|uniref:Uncharacterized protein n=1 Tax=Massilia eburnea TaxID=1776165 RepID=A0A6L6QBG0_9BURK|nr:hypothetical protein [Massilia eburnea]MTW09073.1 hypothetical protein [Massilia eburnea]